MKNKKQGFTLAEVLLTLTIIGVVSALTVPSLMQSSEEKKLSASAKKAYNTLQNGLNIIYANTESTPADAIQWTFLDAYTGCAWHENHSKTDVSYDGGKTWQCYDGKTTHAVIDMVKSQWSFAFQTPDGIIYTDSAVNGNKVCEDTANPSSAVCQVVVDVNGEQGPNYSTALSKLNNSERTVDGRPLKYLYENTELHKIKTNYDRKYRDIVIFGVNGMNIFPHPDDAVTQKYIRGTVTGAAK